MAMFKEISRLEGQNKVDNTFLSKPILARASVTQFNSIIALERGSRKFKDALTKFNVFYWPSVSSDDGYYIVQCYLH